MKICTGCGESRATSEFHKNNRNKDGLRSNCKVCCATYHSERRGSAAQVKSEGIAVSKYRASALGQETKARYQASAAGKEIQAKAGAKYHSLNPEKRKAKGAVRTAVKSGVITRPTQCSACEFAGKIEAHHHSYLKEHWLDVAWLCRGCHIAEHKRLKDLIKKERGA